MSKPEFIEKACDDCGDPNEEYDSDYTAQDAIDDIHEIVGEI